MCVPAPADSLPFQRSYSNAPDVRANLDRKCSGSIILGSALLGGVVFEQTYVAFVQFEI